MQSSFSSSLANVFSAFSKGLEGGERNVGTSEVPLNQGVAQATSDSDTFNLLKSLKILENAPAGRLPFSQFSSQLPGDPVASLSSTVQLMKVGWVEFVGDISENSEVRLTDQGRQALATLAGSIAAS